MSEPVPARPSATVVLLREAEVGFEVLLLRRNHRIVFHGGEWVFPGGSVDATDAGHDDPFSLEAARRAAVRETAEEAGVHITEDALVAIAHWTTPVHFPKRFATWFFAAKLPPSEVRIDRDEITAHRSIAPRVALEARARGELGLPPPTFLTLLELAEAASPASFLDAARCVSPPRYLPRYRAVEGGECSLLPGDAAYDGLPLDTEGPRHRLYIVGGDYRLEKRL